MELLSAHFITLLDSRSPLTFSSRHRRRDLRSSLLSPRAALDDATFVLARHFQNRPCFKRASESPPKNTNAAARHELPQPVLPHHKPTRATIPKIGRRGDDLANRLDQRSYFALIGYQRLCSSMEQQAVSRSCCCRTRRMELKSSHKSPPDPSPLVE